MACNSCFSKGSSLPAEMWRKHATYYGSDWQSPSWPSKMTERNAKAQSRMFFSLLFLEIQNSASLKNRMCLLWCSEYQSRAKRHLVGLLFFWYHYYSKLCTIHVKWLIDSLPNAQSIDFCAKSASRRLGGVSPKSITKYLLLCKSRNKMTFLPHSILKTRKNRHFFKMCKRNELVKISQFFCS